MTALDCIKDLISGSGVPGSPCRDLIFKLFIGVFFSGLFIQSGLDKVTDRKGNLDWLIGHFAKTFMKNMVPLLLTIMTVLELSAALLSVIGVFALLFTGSEIFYYWGCLISAKALIYLFIGQRIAKDYDGARTIVIYFIVALMGILI